MALGLRTVVCLPYATPERILGVLYLDRERLDPILSSEDLSLLVALTTLAASGVQRERERVQAEVKATQLQRCAELGRRFAKACSPTGFLRQLVEVGLEIVEGEHGYCLVSEGDDWRASVALAADSRPVGFSAEQISRGIATWVLEHQEPLSLLDAGSEEGWQDRKSVMSLGLRTVFCLPIAGLPGSVLYFDSPRLVDRNPEGMLRELQALIDYASPLLTLP